MLYIDIAWRINSLMKDRGINQVDLAERVGKTQSFISKVISGSKRANLELISQICIALDVSIAEFFSVFDGHQEELPDYVRAFCARCRHLSGEEVQVLSSLVSLMPSFSQETASQIDNAILPVLGSAAAGSPIFAPSFDGESVIVPSRFANSDHFFAVQACGDSMSPRVMSGDYVIVKSGSTPEIGELVLARGEGIGNDEYAIKKLRGMGSVILLASINPDYPVLRVPASRIHSLERVVHIIHAGRA